MASLRSLAHAAERKTEGKPEMQDEMAFHYAACAKEAEQVKRNSHVGMLIIRRRAS